MNKKAIQLPLYQQAQKVTGQFKNATKMTPMVTGLITSDKTYVIDSNQARAVQWYQNTLQNAGYRITGHGASSGNVIFYMYE